MTGRHRSPPMLARWLPHVTVLAVVGIVGPPVWLFAVTIGADASAASAAAARDSVTVSTAARSARTVSVPLTVLPVPVPSIGASGAWDPDAGLPKSTPENALSRPVPFAGVQGHAEAPVTTPTGLSASPSPIETTPDSPRATQTPDTTAPPAETTAAATTTESSATPTEEPTVTPTSSAEPTPTDIGDVVEDVLEPEPTP